MLPLFRRILRRINETKAMRFWFHNFNDVLSFRVKGVPFRCNAVAEKLAALFVAIPVDFMNLKNRAGNELGVVRIKRYKSVDICWTLVQEKAVIGSAPSGIVICFSYCEETIAALSVSQNRKVPPESAMHFSSIPRNRRPPDVMREAMCGANHFPGSSITSDVV